MKQKYILLINLIVLGTAALSCQKADVRGARVIHFEDLMQKKQQRTLSWINPDQTKEKLSFFEAEIPYTNKVRALATEYLRDTYRENFSASMYSVAPTMIVIHSMALGSLEKSLTLSGFLNDEMGWDVPRGGRFPVGAHFMVDIDGTIYCLSPPKNLESITDYGVNAKFVLRRHLAEASPFSIGIENVVPFVKNAMDLTDEKKAEIFSNFSAAQIENNAKLIRWLLSRNKKITKIFGHHQFNRVEFRNKLKVNKSVIPVSFDSQSVTSNRFDPGEDVLKKIVNLVKKHNHNVSNLP